MSAAERYDEPPAVAMGDLDQLGQDAHEVEEESRLYAEFLKDRWLLKPGEDAF